MIYIADLVNNISSEFSVFISIAFSLCALFYEIFIIFMYMSKKKYRNIENSIFITLLIVTFFLVLIEIAYVYFIYMYKTRMDMNMTNFANLMCKTYLNGVIVWEFIFLFYIYTLKTKPIADRKIKNEKRKYFLFLLCIFGFISIIFANNVFDINIKAPKIKTAQMTVSKEDGNFLDSEYMEKEDIHILKEDEKTIVYEKELKTPSTNSNGEKLKMYTGLYKFDGPAVYVAFIIAGIVVIFMLYIFVIRRDTIGNNQRKTMYLAIFIILITTLMQVFDTGKYDFNIQNFQFVIILMALFFTLENQDTKLLSEHEASRIEAEKANSEQTEFLTSMSHEIRTPMNTIMGFSDALIREGAKDKDVVKNDTENIHKAAVSLLELINNILDLSRIESGRENVVEKEVELQSIIVELNDLVYTKINKEKIDFKIEIDENLPSKVLCDNTKFVKILSNLLVNVINYTKEGKINFIIGTTNDNDDKFTFSFDIISNGSYIIQEDYEKYYRDENSTTNSVNNEVLGVNVARMYANMLDGKITFNSVYGKNIRYNVKLNAQITDPRPIGNISALLTTNSTEKHKVTLEGKKILVVDDNQMNIKLISRLLAEYKPTIESAINGQECLDKAQDTNYDLIFLDHMMPGMDGIQTLSKLKDLIKNLPPVIALTANSYAGIKEMYISNGFDDYLAKPINRNDLNKLLYEIFNNK